LLCVIALWVVQINHFDAFLQRHADTFPAQNQLYANAVSRGIDSFLPLAQGVDESFFLVKTDGAGGDPELASQL
jgi:hypothetical protein